MSQTRLPGNNQQEEIEHEAVTELKRSIINDLASKDHLTAAQNIKSLHKNYGVVYLTSIRSTLDMMTKEAVAILSHANKSHALTHKRERQLLSTMRQMGLVDKIKIYEQLHQMMTNELAHQPARNQPKNK